MPLAEYERVAKEVEIYQQKNGDLLVRNKEYAAKVSGLQAELREAGETVDAQRDLRADKDELEKEFNRVRMRLEALDPKYRWENQLYHRIVERLKRSRVSVTQAFEAFDEDGDGQLSRGEFQVGLGQLGLGDLSNNDVDVLMGAIDVDGDGRIQYSEFARKLQRCGLKSLSAQEMLVFNIVKTLRSLSMTRADLFKLINKDGEGLVTRMDFRDALSSLKMAEVRKEDIQSFIDYFYKDEKGGIDLASFVRIFERYERQIEIDEHPAAAHDRRRRPRVPREVLQRKQDVFKQVHFALAKEGASLRTLFKTMDVDGSRGIGLEELRRALTDGMRVALTEADCKHIFDSIDIDRSGTIDWAEFQLDFDRCLNKTLDELDEEERLLHQDRSDDAGLLLGLSGPTPGYGGATGSGKLGSLTELEYQRRVASLEDKVKQAYLELRNEHALRNLNDESLKLLQKHHEDLRKQFDYTRDEYFKLQKSLKEHEEALRLSIRKEVAEKI